jgi:hypothetical protein
MKTGAQFGRSLCAKGWSRVIPGSISTGNTLRNGESNNHVRYQDVFGNMSLRAIGRLDQSILSKWPPREQLTHDNVFDDAVQQRAMAFFQTSLILQIFDATVGAC